MTLQVLCDMMIMLDYGTLGLDFEHCIRVL